MAEPTAERRGRTDDRHDDRHEGRKDGRRDVRDDGRRYVREPGPATSRGDYDLLLDLAGRHSRAALEDALREAVREGRLAAGTRLPSSRVLAKDLGLARNTVADAYGQLVAEGWLTARQGSGTSVAAPPVAPAPVRGPLLGPRPAGAAGGVVRDLEARGFGGGGVGAYDLGTYDLGTYGLGTYGLGTSPEPHGAPVPPAPHGAPAPLLPSAQNAPRPPYVLWPGSPDLSSFPRTAWAAAARRALMAAPNEALGYSDPRGRIELRAALAAYLARVRGVRTDPELLVVCSGYAQAVTVLGRALRARGARRVAVEEVGLPDTRVQLAAAGLEPVTLPVDAEGAAVERLDAYGDGAAGSCAAVFLTPAHQFPMGVSLSPARRAAVVEWARRTGGVVVEDDYDGEFRYDRQPVGALQGLAPEQVVYAGTASKSLAPGLRLAWIAVPPHLLEDVVREKRLSDHLSPVLDQLTLAEFIGSGAYDRHVRRMRLRYRARRDRLVAALAERVPSVRLSGIAAGLHALLELPPGAAPLEEVVSRARHHGLALGALPVYGAPPTAPPALVIGYATPPDHAFTEALTRLCDVLASPDVHPG
ncbi:PLP-dependent aminotransferase family protein [Actinacidiphila sp. DG2A-62]|uniref:aminotransferase-like domain-containing protein n=1 Tax=Actinacidiphila sp. DG2A-62 TaxID=3108821 RepID=UPI002DBE1F4D|nr:PLP-dependent aminotransferase family protein [Actinacidiphila sp. DG2A-62]MEC3996554.1 PLP-dependent aminotransferase family protein [Actinacidiphila sp. DG2A-62]